MKTSNKTYPLKFLRVTQMLEGSIKQKNHYLQLHYSRPGEFKRTNGKTTNGFRKIANCIRNTQRLI